MPTSDVRARAMSALGEIRDPRATGAITAALKDADARVRARAASTLSELRDPASVDALIAATKDADVNVRRHAVRALGEIRDARALPALTAGAQGRGCGSPPACHRGDRRDRRGP